MPRRPHLLTWHPGLQRYVGHGGPGLVVTVAAWTVEAVYEENFRWWRLRRSEAQADAEASRAALYAGVYSLVARAAERSAISKRKPTAWYKEVATWDCWLCHPANVPPVAPMLLDR